MYRFALAGIVLSLNPIYSSYLNNLIPMIFLKTYLLPKKLTYC